jgi:hypothetical protein
MTRPFTDMLSCVICPSVRHLPLLCIFAAALAVGGCSSPARKAAKLAAREQKLIEKENSRVIESRRMRALDYGDVASARGAQMLIADPSKTFDPSRSGVGTIRQFGTGGTRTKEFNYDQKARTGNFLTRAFGGSKSNFATDKKFAAGEAYVKGKYAVPDSKVDGNKTVDTRKARDGEKTAATNATHDSTRQYLGPEQKKLGKAIDFRTLADWRTGETVIYNGAAVDRASTFKQMTIGDIRELLNKNK